MSNTNASQYTHPVSFQLEQAAEFLEKYHGEKVERVQPVETGLWSKAFFYTHNSGEYVLRIGNEDESYKKDQIAFRFSSPKMPIPEVLELGTIGKRFFSISKRHTGMMIDKLPKDQVKKLIPAIMDLLDALREVDISSSSGYGEWNSKEHGSHKSWKNYLRDIGNDNPTSKIHGWKHSLENSPQGVKEFDEALQLLETLTESTYEGRHIVHTDLTYFNVLIERGKISAVIDWGNSVYGDYLYELANFTVWEPIHKSLTGSDLVTGFDWRNIAHEYFQKKGADIKDFDKRLRTCELHIGLAGMAWSAHCKNWDELRTITNRVNSLK